MEEKDRDRIGAGIVLVEPGEFAEGGEIRSSQARASQGVAVALPLEMPADTVLQRFEEQRKTC